MTIYAKLHVEPVDFSNPVHFLYIPVTTAAVYLPVDMNGMVEKDKIGHVLNFKPFNRLVIIKMRPQVFNFRVMNDDSFVTKHAGLERRYPCPLRVDCPIVAHETANAFH